MGDLRSLRGETRRMHGRRTSCHVVGQRGPDRLGPGQLVAFRSGVQGFELLGREPYSDNLHRLGPTSGAAATSALQLSHVVAGLGLVGPLLKLPFARHGLIV